jgi:hypothetical protein
VNDIEPAALQRDHPAWHIRRSPVGDYFLATRHDRMSLTDAELHAGLSMTLIENTPTQLREALTHEAEIEATL